MTDTSPAALRALADNMDKFSAAHCAGRLCCSDPGCLCVTVIETLRALAAEKNETVSLMADPNAVHLNMLRGAVAKPTIDQIVHLYGREALLAALAAEKEAGAPAPDGWTPWEGGRCPVVSGTTVDVMYRDGGETEGYVESGALRWDHIGAGGDIIAFRIAKEG